MRLRGRKWYIFYRKGKHELLVLTDMKVKRNGGVSWCFINNQESESVKVCEILVYDPSERDEGREIF